MRRLVRVGIQHGRLTCFIILIMLIRRRSFRGISSADLVSFGRLTMFNVNNLLTTNVFQRLSSEWPQTEGVEVDSFFVAGLGLDVDRVSSHVLADH